MRLRAVIVDDEPLARDELTFLLGQCDRVDVVGEASGVVEARALCAEHRPEVAFIDLRMPASDGITLAQQLRGEFPGLAVIIVSAHEEAAIRGFEACITDYLLKPVRLRRLRQALERVSAPVDSGNDDDSRFRRFAVRRRGAFVVVEVRDVVYFEARDELVWAVTEEDRYAMDVRLTRLARRLDPTEFFQSHRSCIVRIDRIRKIERAGARTFRLLLEHPDQPRIPLARERAPKLREQIPFTR